VSASDRGGFALDVSYYTLESAEPRRTVSLLVFTDARGFLSTLEVNYQGNTSDMPEQVQLEEPRGRAGHVGRCGETLAQIRKKRGSTYRDEKCHQR